MATESRKVIRASIMEDKLETLISKNIVVLPGMIDTRMASTLLVDLLYQKIEPRDKPLWVFINSPGGMLNQGLAIYDILRMISEAGTIVYTVALGDTASMAITVLQAGTRRYSFPNTQFTIHQARMSGDGDPQEVNQLMENAKELERQNGIVLKIVAERTGMPLKELLELSKKTDYSVDANAALKFGSYGLIDEVITCLPFLKTA